jgi:hypothetical protein
MSTALAREERLGLGIAIAAHAALVVLLIWHATREPGEIPVPERMVVSLADDVALTSAAPNPSLESQAAIAPTLADEPAPPEVVEREVTPRPEPEARTPRATRAAPAQRSQPTPRRNSGGSRIGDNFLEGNADSGSARGTPAETFGAAEAASLNAAISRQLRPHWNAPSGVDAELLVTIVRFRLNRDGSLAGAPTCTQQSGETASNATQVGLHCERAIRAVRLAAPFDLPEQFYDKWKLINSRFDRRL